MGIDSVRAALQLLTGAGELTRARATEAAATLLEVPGLGETSARASQLAEELIDAATANQQMMHELVRTELEKQLTRVGLVRGSDLDAAREKIDALEAEVEQLRAQLAGQGAPAATATAAGSVSRSAIKNAARPSRTGVGEAKERTASGSAERPITKSAKKTPAKTSTSKDAATRASAKAATTKTSAKKTSAKKSGTKKSAKKAAGKKTATTAPRASAKKAAGKKAAAKATSARTAKK